MWSLWKTCGQVPFPGYLGFRVAVKATGFWARRHQATQSIANSVWSTSAGIAGAAPGFGVFLAGVGDERFFCFPDLDGFGWCGEVQGSVDG